jgi:prepilin-type N-terminal cleavage/methylation domain-containing protein
MQSKNMNRKTVKKGFKGFTLAELLIALAILGVIATFTIPKVLQSQQDSKNKAIAKEGAGTISAAYDAYRAKNNSTTMSTYMLTPYFNYVKLDTTSTVDNPPGAGGTTSCSSGNPQCFRLHSGAIMYFWDDGFCNASISAIPFNFDIDGKVTAGNSDTVTFLLSPNGRIRTWSSIEGTAQWTNTGPGTACSLSASSYSGLSDPTWFSWN